MISNEDSISDIKIFVLGDSRTGTLSLSNFFLAVGYPSVHFYGKEANLLPTERENQSENFHRLKNFIDENDYVAFTDYPTRLFYSELAEQYPKAYFILTVRRDINTWRKSMLNFFSKFKMDIDLDDLTSTHVNINDEIRDYFGQRPEICFLELCIDDDSAQNTASIKKFLNIETNLVLGWDNKFANIDNDLISGRVRIINPTDKDVIAQIEGYRASFHGLLSEFGWIYLINDSNNFMSYLYGTSGWTESNLQRVNDLMTSRLDKLHSAGLKYVKFIMPEKHVIYPEFLPKAMRDLDQLSDRPSVKLAEMFPDHVYYLGDYLLDAKSYGTLYFRGDTHCNWLASYLVYQFVIKKIQPLIGNRLPPPIPARALVPSISGFDGDLFEQISPDDRAYLDIQWDDVQFSKVFEYCIKYDIHPDQRRAKTVNAEGQLADMKFSRDMIIKEIDDPSLPTAVIFRDSTIDHMIDFLAEHFRRCIFIWHRGEVVKDVLEAENPDIVLHFMAERFVQAYSEHMLPISNYFPDPPETVYKT